MRVNFILSQVEAAEAMKDYLVKRGVLPLHAEVNSVGAGDGTSYRSSEEIKVAATVEAAPVAPILTYPGTTTAAPQTSGGAP